MVVSPSLRYAMLFLPLPPFAFHVGLPLSRPLQVARLQDLVREGEQGLGSAEGHISSLKEAQENLLVELDATRSRLRETGNLLTALQVGALAGHHSTSPGPPRFTD